jgi:hypothetical protein
MPVAGVAGLVADTPAAWAEVAADVYRGEVRGDLAEQDGTLGGHYRGYPPAQSVGLHLLNVTNTVARERSGSDAIQISRSPCCSEHQQSP